MIRLLNPEALSLMVLSTVLLFVLLRAKNPRPLMYLTLFRVLALFFVCLALANPVWVQKELSRDSQILVAVDRSDSVRPEELQRIEREYFPVLQQFGQQDPDRVQWLELGDPSLDSQTRLVEPIERQANELGSPPRAQCLLMTDGYDTRYSLERVAALSHLGCWFVLLEAKPARLNRIASVKAPGMIQKNSSFAVQALVRSTTQSSLFLELKRNGELLESRELNLENQVAVQEFEQEPLKPGNYDFTLDLRDGESDLLHSKSVDVSVIASKSVLVLSDQNAQALKKVLELGGYRVTLRSPQSFSKVSGYEAVFLNNLSHASLGQYEPELIQYVEGGGSLGVLGGDSSFGLGGYLNSNLETLLPVFSPPRSYRKSMAMMLIIDASGSMLAEDPAIWGDPKQLMQWLKTSDPMDRPIEIAKISAAEVLNDLQGVEVAVLRFSEFASVAVPLVRVADSTLPSIRAGIQSINPGGGTRFLPPLQTAFKMLRSQNFEKSHVLFFSDGTPRDANQLNSVLEGFYREQIPISTIAFGSNANVELLQRMARMTEGRAYRSGSMQNLKASFQKAVDEVFGPPVVEERTALKWGAAASEIQFDRPKSPFDVNGYVSTAPKKSARVLVESVRGEPLVAYWKRGTGGSFVFPSEFGSSWSRPWMDQGFTVQLLAFLIQKTRQSDREQLLSVHSSVHGQNISIRIQVLDEALLRDSGLQLQAELRMDQQSIPIDLRSMKDGWYEGKRLVPKEGKGRVLVTLRAANQKIRKEVMVRLNADTERLRGGWPRELQSLLPAESKIESAKQLQNKLYNLQSETEKQQSLAFLPALLALFALCAEILLRRLRVFDTPTESSREDPNLRQARIWWKRAREAVANEDLQEAEKWFLAAHRAAIKARDEGLKRRIFEDMRSRT